MKICENTGMYMPAYIKYKHRKCPLDKWQPIVIIQK